MALELRVRVGAEVEARVTVKDDTAPSHTAEAGEGQADVLDFPLGPNSNLNPNPNPNPRPYR